LQIFDCIFQREPNSGVLIFDRRGILPLPRNLISRRKVLSEDAAKNLQSPVNPI